MIPTLHANTFGRQIPSLRLTAQGAHWDAEIRRGRPGVKKLRSGAGHQHARGHPESVVSDLAGEHAPLAVSSATVAAMSSHKREMSWRCGVDQAWPAWSPDVGCTPSSEGPVLKMSHPHVRRQTATRDVSEKGPGRVGVVGVDQAVDPCDHGRQVTPALLGSQETPPSRLARNLPETGNETAGVGVVALGSPERNQGGGLDLKRARRIPLHPRG